MKSFLKNLNFSLKISALQKGRIVNIFFLALCVFSIAMVGILNLQSSDETKKTQAISRFEIFDFEYYQVDSSGVKVYAKGERARKNQNDEDELENFVVHNYLFEEKKQEILSSDFAQHKNNIINFKKGVNYEHDGLKFWSKEAIYWVKTKKLLGEGDFLVLGNNYRVVGKDIVYEGGKVFAQDIVGKMKMDK